MTFWRGSLVPAGRALGNTFAFGSGVLGAANPDADPLRRSASGLGAAQNAYGLWNRFGGGGTTPGSNLAFGPGVGAVAGALNAAAPGQTAFGRGINAAQSAGQAASMLGGQVGAAAGSVAPVLNVAAGAYNIYNILNSELNRREKIKQGALTGVGMAVPLVGVANAAYNLLEPTLTSSSTPVRQVGTGLRSVIEPSGATAFWDMLGGGSPFKGQNIAKELTLDMLGPVGSIIRAFGAKPPTRGVQMRQGFNTVAGELLDPGFKGTGAYNMDPKKLETMSPMAKSAAHVLGNFFSAFSPKFNKDPVAFGGQGMNILLNNYGEDVVGQVPIAFGKLGFADPRQAMMGYLDNVRRSGAQIPEADLKGLWTSLNALYGLDDSAPMPTLADLPPV